MTITRYNPGTIFLGGNRVQIGDIAAAEAITPGHLIERVNTAGVWRWRKHATAGAATGCIVATNQSMLNMGCDDPYAIGDLVEASVLEPGATAWMLIASGQNIAFGDKLESAGDGTLRKGGLGTFIANETKNATSLTRLRVEAQ